MNKRKYLYFEIIITATNRNTSEGGLLLTDFNFWPLSRSLEFINRKDFPIRLFFTLQSSKYILPIPSFARCDGLSFCISSYMLYLLIGKAI